MSADYTYTAELLSYTDTDTAIGLSMLIATRYWLMYSMVLMLGLP